MPQRSTDLQSFSGFASLHRADLTHEPGKHGVPWGRIALVAVAGVVAALVLRVLLAF